MHLCVMALAGCAGQSPAPTTPVKATTTAPEPERVGNTELPPWPSEEAPSAEFERALSQARSFHELDAPAPPTGDQKAFETYMATDLARFIADSGGRLDSLQQTLARIPGSRPGERAAGTAMLGLCLTHFADAFARLPAPPAVTDDAELELIFRAGLDRAVVPWLRRAADAHGYCAASAREHQKLERWKPWLDFCRSHREAVVARLSEAEARAAAGERARETREQGERPPGSELCWSPATGRGPTLPARAAGPPAPAIVDIDLVDPSRVPLLERERKELAAAVRRALALRYEQAELTVKWLDERGERALLADWSAGRHLQGGARCALPLELAEYRRKNLPNLEAANVWPNCEEGGACNLVVDLGAGGVGAALGYRRLQAPLREPLGELDNWLAAVEKLAPVEGEAGSVGLLSGRWNAPAGSLLSLHNLEVHGDWAKPRGAWDTVAAAESGLGACDGMGGDSDRSLIAVLDVKPDGSVGGLWQAPAPALFAAQDRCVAKVLRGLHFASGSGVRRVTVRFSIGRGQSATPRDYAYGALDLASGVRVSVASADNASLSPAPLSDSPARARLSACLGGAAPGVDGTVELSTELGVGADGRTRSARVDILPTSEAKVGADTVRCIERALRETRFACTVDKKATTLTATICLRSEADNEKTADAATGETGDEGEPAAPVQAPQSP